MRVVLVFFAAAALQGQPVYDLLLTNGHVIDPRNQIDGVRDVAIRNGVIAEVAARIEAGKAKKVVDVGTLYVTPGLVDLHTHIFGGSGLLGSLPTDQNVFPDSHTLRSCVTTAVDAGTSGWRRFPEFKEKIIDKSNTRVLALLNILGNGQAGPQLEQDVQDMDPEAAARMVKKYKGTIVGIKTAHYRGPEWVAVERAVLAGELGGVPIMVDFGLFHPARPFEELVGKKLRPGDMYTHTFVPAAPLLDANGKLRPYLFEAQKRGVKFDVGHGGGSFLFRQAVPALRQGFRPDSISTDLHTGSMNGAMNNMLNVMSKFLNMGLKLDDVVLRATWNPARQIQRPDLGHLSVGAPADIAVIRVEHGRFGFVDINGGKLTGTERLSCDMTLRDGQVLYDLNGLTRAEWTTLPKDYPKLTGEWDAVIQPPVRKAK